MAKDKVKIIQKIQILKKIKIIHLVRKKINKSLQLDFSKYKIIKINNIINKVLLPIIPKNSTKLLNKTSSDSLLSLLPTVPTVGTESKAASNPHVVISNKNNKNINKSKIKNIKTVFFTGKNFNFINRNYIKLITSKNTLFYTKENKYGEKLITFFLIPLI